MHFRLRLRFGDHAENCSAVQPGNGKISLALRRHDEVRVATRFTRLCLSETGTSHFEYESSELKLPRHGHDDKQVTAVDDFRC